MGVGGRIRKKAPGRGISRITTVGNPDTCCREAGQCVPGAGRAPAGISDNPLF
jgi:hypothetical protein